MGTDHDLARPWLNHGPATVAGRPCALARVSFAGELGWEIHAANEHVPALWDAVIEAGAKPFGMIALDSMRLEKGWLAWKQDLSSDYTLRELGLARFMRDPGPEPARRMTLLTHEGARDPLYMANVSHDGAIVGEVTSAAWGHRCGKAIALAMLPAGLGEGTTVSIDMFGEAVPATVLPGPAWDADFERIRA